MERLFSIPLEKAINEVGEKRLKRDLEGLRNHLIDAKDQCPNNSFEFRYAPSIVARTEAELFGLSMPRFAVRAYLDRRRSQFVNLRRIDTFCMMKPRWGTPRGGEGWVKALRAPIEFDPDAEDFWAIMREASCIGDCVVRPVSHVQASYDFLEAKLGAAYGENPRVSGTPFVRHIRCSGGGLCAQAVCFMAMALRHEDPQPLGGQRVMVHGLAEVTALAAEPATNELVLTGLSKSKLRDYFKNSLHGFPVWQHASRTEGAPPQCQRFAMNLRTYLRAGIPLIIPVDTARMAGVGPLAKASIKTASDDYRRRYPVYEDCIYYRNGLEKQIKAMQKEYTSDRRHRNHVVLAVGWEDDEKSQEFLINDPGTLPFMKASAEQLWKAATYKSSSKTEEAPSADDSRPLYQTNAHIEGTDSVASGTFMAIAPATVRLPLESWMRDDEQKPQSQFGLLDIAELVIDTLNDRQGLPRVAAGFKHRLGNFYLVQLGNLAEGRQRRPKYRLRHLHTTMDEVDLQKISQHLLKSGWDPECWLWLLHLPQESPSSPESVWVWNAQALPPERNDLTDKDVTPDFVDTYLCYVGKRAEAQWEHCKVTRYTSEGAVEEEACVPQAHGELKPSLISSFILDGISEARPHYQRNSRHGAIACDLYALMHTDDVFSLDNSLEGYLEDRAVVIKLAGYLAEGRERVLRASEQLVAALADGPRVVAFSTFFPELSATEEADAKNAQDALIFLIKVAREMSRTSKGLHHPNVIELVAGSRMDGVWPFKYCDPNRNASPKEARYIANRISVDEALSRLIERLQPVAVEAFEDEQGKRISLAVELEPGPLYALNEWLTIAKFCQKLGSSQTPREVSQVVGLNLDVAHWKLADIDLRLLYSNDDPGRMVRQRITHSHISDHGRGHFGDAAPGTVGLGDYCVRRRERFAAFKPWIQFLRYVRSESRENNLPPFSGYLSLELEACRGPGVLALGVKNLLELLE
ncbi:MAG TPA: hypothetical protein VGQ99_21515 [Tepidisphaeraceae bacterium]|jgi:hypothetical protein|nr:hypothetical protein [Tepidisphaeraceae bacterium]